MKTTLALFLLFTLGACDGGGSDTDFDFVAENAVSGLGAFGPDSYSGTDCSITVGYTNSGNGLVMVSGKNIRTNAQESKTYTITPQSSCNYYPSNSAPRIDCDYIAQRGRNNWPAFQIYVDDYGDTSAIFTPGPRCSNATKN